MADVDDYVKEFEKQIADIPFTPAPGKKWYDVSDWKINEWASLATIAGVMGALVSHFARKG